MSAESASSGPDAQIEAAARDYPFRRSKIERPILPLETLRRDRLLDWLDATIHRRLILVVAEAGFGKTTLLADFARRTRIRTIWYRIDEDDIDPVTFLRYFIAACRTIDPGLLSRSASLLTEAATRPVTWEAILESVCQELAAIASEPTIIFFDDYHLAERFAPVRQMVERLIARAPERVTFVVASRRAPNLAVARLRACDDLAEVGREDLRFDQQETERLFREVYSQPLETDLLTDLQTRTEGWVASLQLVKAAVRGRSAGEVRHFIATLSAGEGELYDYLAEEVIADLPDETQHFLSRVSILDDIDNSIAAPAADIEPADARVQLTAAQRLGLVTRTARVVGPARLHPLVREFLESRLTAEIGVGGVRALHRRVAVLYEPISWRSAARHWAAAGDGDDVCRVVQAATGTILGTGEFEAADDYITRFAGTAPNPWFDILRSRVAFSKGLVEEAVRLSERVREHAKQRQHDRELGQLEGIHSAFIAFTLSGGDEAVAAAIALESRDLDEEGRAIAAAMRALGEDQDLPGTVPKIEAVRRIAHDLGHTRYEGIAELNLAVIQRLVGDLPSAHDHAARAMRLLGESGTPDEVASAKLTLGQVLAQLRTWDEAVDYARQAFAEWETSSEMAVDVAELMIMFGDPAEARGILDRIDESRLPEGPRRSLVAVARTRLLIAEGRHREATRAIEAVIARPAYCGFRSLLPTLRAHLAIAEGAPSAAGFVVEAIDQSKRQGSMFSLRTARVLESVLDGPRVLSAAIASAGPAERPHLSIVAEVLVSRMATLDDAAIEVVKAQASGHPDRWRPCLRRHLETDHRSPNAVAVGRVLESIGDASDIRQLRRVARASPRARANDLGRGLIRNLAARVRIDDLGPVMLTVGDRHIAGAEIRRKPLALVCFLLTKPRFAATADQVLDALWPGLDPETAANSLNQTVYFLRRVIEPGYDDAVSAGYVRHDSDLIWLDQELVSSRSEDCRALMTSIGRDPKQELVDELAAKYIAPFGLDFAYDDWASAYRESLHARYLSILETAIGRESDAGRLDRAIMLAQRVIQVDPDAGQVELHLLRLYRATGAHSAAAEQYSHYAEMYREETGAYPPPLDSL